MISSSKSRARRAAGEMSIKILARNRKLLAVQARRNGLGGRLAVCGGLPTRAATSLAHDEEPYWSGTFVTWCSAHLFEAALRDQAEISDA